MALSQAYLDWEKKTEERGVQQELLQGLLQEKALVLRLLNRRVGTVPEPLQTQVNALSGGELESLGDALLDFISLSDLEQWLRSHPST